MNQALLKFAIRDWLKSTTALAWMGSPSRRFLSTRGGIVYPSTLLRFDIKKHEMEKRRMRELAKASSSSIVDHEDDEDDSFISPEEQHRREEEEKQSRLEEERIRTQLLEKRSIEEAEKRRRFMEFRARQIEMSHKRKETTAAKKEANRAMKGQQQRHLGRIINEEESTDSPKNNTASSS
ncbi:unnamed protein product [Phytomonas sp. Hart1]|nr:unnamed protein product [Phytomonas sp. Hart1]|eukprot:CCW69873.1 unnamed protein product [Phytomonas sp. isolate Hart1]